MALPIETDNLSKRYHDVAAVIDLSLRVRSGEIYAFLGLNGAGKTTTIRMLLGMVRPTGGAARVLGTTIRPGTLRPWNDVGHFVESSSSYPELTVRENLEVIRRLRPGISGSAVDAVIDRLGLGTYAQRRARTLSLGNAQRLSLARALLPSPRLLILDEPANGLDPAGIVEVRNLLLELAKEQGVTVFMSSHILAEVSRLADRVGIIHHGRLIQELDIEELHRNRQRRLVIGARALADACQTLVQAGYPARITSDELIEIRTGLAMQEPEKVSALLVQKGFPPTMLAVQEEDLEHYFLRLVGVEEEAFS